MQSESTVYAEVPNDRFPQTESKYWKHFSGYPEYVL